MSEQERHEPQISDYRTQEALIRLTVQVENINREVRDMRTDMRQISDKTVSKEEFKATLEAIDAKFSPLNKGVFAGVSLVATGFFGIVAYWLTHNAPG